MYALPGSGAGMVSVNHDGTREAKGDQPRFPGARTSGLDRGPLGVRAGVQLDLPGLRLLRDRHRQPHDAAFVARLDPLEVEVVAENELAAEPAARTFRGEHLPVTVARDALGADGQDVALDVEVDAL